MKKISARARVAAAVLCLAFVAAGCSKSDDGDKASGKTTTTAAAGGKKTAAQQAETQDLIDEAKDEAPTEDLANDDATAESATTTTTEVAPAPTEVESTTTTTTVPRPEPVSISGTVPEDGSETIKVTVVAGTRATLTVTPSDGLDIVVSVAGPGQDGTALDDGLSGQPEEVVLPEGEYVVTVAGWIGGGGDYEATLTTIA